MNRTRRQQGKAAFDLIEEAVHRLRAASPATLAAYYVGAIPFVLGLLYFWTDMSSSPFADQHATGAALGVAGLFLWMKFWQADFARRIRAQLAAQPPPRWTLGRCGRIVLTQTIVQPSGLFAIPLALIPLLPFAWVYAFYQNVTALAGTETRSPSGFLKRAWRQAKLWPGQNHAALASLGLFGFYVFLNWTTVCLLLPSLLKMLLGVQSVFSRSPASLLNPTFFAGMLGLTYLCLDPILKVVYALRCFYGESLESGEDLKAVLKPFATEPEAAPPGGDAPRAGRVPGAILAARTGLIALFLLLVLPAVAAPPAHRDVSASQLNRAIGQTIHESKYAWRLPHQPVTTPDTRENILSRFFDGVGRSLHRWARALADWVWGRLKRLFHHRPSGYTTQNSGYGWIESLELLLYGLIVVAATALAVLLYRLWQGRRNPPAPAAGEKISQMPDLGDEHLGAEELPGEGWMALARDCLERGELRLALRAFYLASLSHLAARHLISLARCKSNREYERELRRRGHAYPDLLSLFADNLSVFERVWYGLHQVSREGVEQFAANVENMRNAQ